MWQRGSSKLRRRQRLGLQSEEGEEQLSLRWAKRRKVGLLGCVDETPLRLAREEFQRK
jgi:hypothetical protein